MTGLGCDGSSWHAVNAAARATRTTGRPSQLPHWFELLEDQLGHGLALGGVRVPRSRGARLGNGAGHPRLLPAGVVALADGPSMSMKVSVVVVRDRLERVVEAVDDPACVGVVARPAAAAGRRCLRPGRRAGSRSG